MNAPDMVPRMVYTVSFQCRHEPDDNGIVEAFWTGEIDTWGKRTIQPVDGSPTIYLFDDEITEVED